MLANTKCSQSFCRSRDRPKCRISGNIDGKAVWHPQLQAWEISDDFRPMKSNTGDIHAYVHKDYENAPVPQGATTRHLRDRQYTIARRNNILKNKITPNTRRDFRARNSTSLLSITNQNTKQVLPGRMRLITKRDLVVPEILTTANIKLMNFLRFIQDSIAGPGSAPGYNGFEVLGDALNEMAANFPDDPVSPDMRYDGDEYDRFLLVTFIDETGGENYNTPIAGVIFTIDDPKMAYMHVNMIDSNKPFKHEVENAPHPAEIAPEGSLNRVMHIDQVVTNPVYAGNGLATLMLEFLKAITPDDIVYYGLYTGSTPPYAPMRKIATRIGMMPNKVYSFPPDYYEAGFDLSYMAPFQPFPNRPTLQ